MNRIKEVEDYLNAYFGHCVCNGSFVNVDILNGKLTVSVNRNGYFIRERRKGRGIQAMRIVNLIVKLGVGTRLNDKTIVLGKDLQLVT